ncbi:DUF2062 domain-containing protein [Thermodesulfobacteriota bacterium]
MPRLRPIKEILAGIFTLDEAAWRISLGLSVGLFIGISPFWGLHTMLAFASAFVFRLNKVTTITGSMLVHPFFIPFIYIPAYKMGQIILVWLGMKDEWPTIVWTIEGVKRAASGAFLAILVGSVLVGLLVAMLAYWISFYMVVRMKQKGNRQ